jgi:hypothetical protein
MISNAPTPRRRSRPRTTACLLPAGLALLVSVIPGLSGCVGSVEHHAAPQTHATLPLVRGSSERQCLTHLGQTQANFTPLPDQSFGTGCSTIGTVRLAWLRSDDAHLQLANLGPVTCSLATALEGWARYGVDHAARLTLGSPLARIDTFGSYNCRNVAGTDHRSAHATANAVDIAAFVLADGRRISVKSDWSSANPATRLFLRQIRTSACRRFGVVLSPDYNAAHHDHFHLETGAPHPVCH